MVKNIHFYNSWYFCILSNFYNEISIGYLCVLES